MTTPYPPGPYIRIGGSVYQVGDNGREIVHGSAIKGDTVQQHHAIADLIAAAPDLLTACRVMLDHLAGREFDGEVFQYNDDLTMVDWLTGVIERAEAIQC